MKLRGHHLICLHFYRGEEAEPAYRKNLLEIIFRAENNERITAIIGPDDVCSCCPYLSGIRCSFEKGSDSAIRIMDEKALELLNLEPGVSVNWSALKKKIAGVLEVWKADYCGDCAWSAACAISDPRNSAD